MLFFYLAFLLFGGVLLGISLLGGGDGDGFETDHSLEMDHSVELDGDIDGDIDTEIEMESEVHLEHEVQTNSSVNQNVAGATQFFSFRNLIYFATFFGLTGTVFTLIDFVTILTLIFSIAMGGFAWIFGYKFMKYLKSSQSGEGINARDLIGHKVKVTLRVGKGKKGKIVVETADGTTELIAECSDIATGDFIERGKEALIIDFKNNIYYVTENDIS